MNSFKLVQLKQNRKSDWHVLWFDETKIGVPSVHRKSGKGFLANNNTIKITQPLCNCMKNVLNESWITQWGFLFPFSDYFT